MSLCERAKFVPRVSPRKAHLSLAEAVKDGLVEHAAISQVLDDDPLQQVRSDPCVPDALGIYGDNRPARADTEAWRFRPLYPRRAEEQVFPLEQRGKLTVKRSPAPVS